MTYLDHAAATATLPEVVEAMLPWLRVPANPASAHRSGRAALAALEAARVEIAALLDRDPDGIVLCSGATEANHAAIRGLARSGARVFAASAIEHPSVHGALCEAGVEVRALSVGPDGVVRVGEAGPADVVCLAAANHETGVRQPVEHVRGTLHVDATHAAGRGPLDVRHAETVALTAHKLGGPPGIGALSVRSGGAFPALLTGGAQERGRRAGTVNVAGAVGFAVACRLARERLSERTARLAGLADGLRGGLAVRGARGVGDPALAVPGTVCVVFPGLRGDLLVHALDLEGVMVSSGAACASGSLEPSPVLRAMGDPEPAGAVRVSLGWDSTDGDVEALLHALDRVLPAVRAAAELE